MRSFRPYSESVKMESSSPETWLSHRTTTKTRPRFRYSRPLSKARWLFMLCLSSSCPERANIMPVHRKPSSRIQAEKISMTAFSLSEST